MSLQIFTLIVSVLLFQSFDWTTQSSGVKSRLRGLSAVNERVAWASGADSTVLRTTDGGITWTKIFVTSDVLDFRDIDAVDAQTAYVLSIGNGAASRIYKTTDAGETWTQQFKADNPKVFLDAMSFWDSTHGIALGDSVDGKFYILITENGGRDWKRVSETLLPPALENEGAFAASGTNIAVFRKTHAWIGTGAAQKSRVLRTADRGRTWTISETPLASGRSAGIFSIAFRDEKHGVVVGGDSSKEQAAVDNVAVTTDGGATWKLVKGLTGYRSVVAYVPSSSRVIAVGPTGSDYSEDGGVNWKPLSGPGFDTFSFPSNRGGRTIGWAAGVNGSIARLKL